MHIDPNRSILILEEEGEGVEKTQKGEDDQINLPQTLLPAKDSHTLPPCFPHFLGLCNTSSGTLIIAEFHCVGKQRLTTQQNC